MPKGTERRLARAAKAFKRRAIKINDDAAAPKMAEIIFTKRMIPTDTFYSASAEVANFYNRDFIPVLYASHRSELMILNRGEKNSVSRKVVREIIRACLWHG